MAKDPQLNRQELVFLLELIREVEGDNVVMRRLADKIGNFGMQRVGDARRKIDEALR